MFLLFETNGRIPIPRWANDVIYRISLSGIEVMPLNAKNTARQLSKESRERTLSEVFKVKCF